MAELSNSANSKRVLFPEGQQKKFFDSLSKTRGLSSSALAKELKLNRRTFSDWTRGKFLLPKNVLDNICVLYDVPYPEKLVFRDNNWIAPIAAKKGGFATYGKYHRIGDSKVRKEGWVKWWQEKGRFNRNQYFVKKNISIPTRSVALAEFVGIMLGDGGITKKQVTITLNKNTDREYSKYVVELINTLFNVRPSELIRKNENVVNLVVSRMSLVDFCKQIGLKVGNKLKQNLDIPEWVSEQKVWQIYCLRGLMDTDGCFFLEIHTIKGKKYNYPRLSIVSYSDSLRKSIHDFLIFLGFTPVIRNERSVQLEYKEDIIRYFKIVGSSNPKHIARFNNFLGGVG